MSELIVIAYDDKFRAEEVRLSLLKMTPDKVIDELKRYGGKVMRTSLTKEDEAKLQAALDSAKQTVETA